VYVEVSSKSCCIMILAYHQTCKCNGKQLKILKTTLYALFQRTKSWQLVYRVVFIVCVNNVPVSFQQHVCHVKIIQQFFTGYIRTGRKTDGLYRDVHMPKTELLIWTLHLSIGPPRTGKGKITRFVSALVLFNRFTGAFTESFTGPNSATLAKCCWSFGAGY